MDNYEKPSRKFDVERYLRHYNVGYTVKELALAKRYLLDHCVFDEAHRKPDAVIFQNSENNLITYHCSHRECSSHGWDQAVQAISGRDDLSPYYVIPGHATGAYLCTQCKYMIIDTYTCSHPEALSLVDGQTRRSCDRARHYDWCGPKALRFAPRDET